MRTPARASLLWALAALLGSPAGARTGDALADAVPIAVQRWSARVQATGDHGHVPYAVVDKRAALMAVYRADGTLAGRTPVLLGATPGDHSVPGVGERTQRGRLRPGDDTTPAGRFVATPGPNHTGEAVIWVDSDAAFAIHRLRPGTTQATRRRALATPGVADNRLSAGCVVVPVQFYAGVVQPLLGRGTAVVYVLPEQTPWPLLWDEIRRRSEPAAL